MIIYIYINKAFLRAIIDIICIIWDIFMAYYIWYVHLQAVSKSSSSVLFSVGWVWCEASSGALERSASRDKEGDCEVGEYKREGE